MQIEDESVERPAEVVTQRPGPMPWLRRWMRVVLTLLITLVLWETLPWQGEFESDASHYQAMAEGKPAMKPFAFRVLGPAAARGFATLTGSSTTTGFKAVGLLSGWILVYGVLSPLLRRRQDLWLAVLMALMPFWLRLFHNFFLSDLPHAALCMIYLVLLRERRWIWAALILIPMFLARESTLLIAVVAVPVLWRLAGRAPALLHTAATLAGMAASKFAARHALANTHELNDTLYMIGKIPWNVARNIFGVTLWTNTLPLGSPIRAWNVPHWIPLGGIHQIGWSRFDPGYLLELPITLLTSFGLASCVVLALLLRFPLRKLLPRDEPYLCIAAIYGAITFVMAPMMGAALARLFDYGWPLFFVYLPKIVPRMWRNNWPLWVVSVLVGLHLISAWTEMFRERGLAISDGVFVVFLLACNVVALWLLLRTTVVRPAPSD